jgi:hypothetical protein
MLHLKELYGGHSCPRPTFLSFFPTSIIVPGCKQLAMGIWFVLSELATRWMRLDLVWNVRPKLLERSVFPGPDIWPGVDLSCVSWETLIGKRAMHLNSFESDPA